MSTCKRSENRFNRFELVAQLGALREQVPRFDLGDFIRRLHLLNLLHGRSGRAGEQRIEDEPRCEI